MITNSAEDKTNLIRNMHFTKSARQGWELILSALDSSSKILLPSYIGITDREGSGIYDPVIYVGIEHDFYMLNEDLTISLSEIEKCLDTSEYSLILLVHYFGFQIKGIEEIVKLCTKHNVIVVEDCAHLYNYNLFNYSPAGTYGDFTFYSLHKFLPFENGGMVLQNASDILTLDFSDINFSNQLSIDLMKYDIKAIADKRRENFIIYESLVRDILGIKPFKTMMDGDIPHNYPIIVENGLREKLYFWLMDRRVPLIALYYRLIAPLQIDRYHSMQLISNNILNLPLHQDMDIESIRYVAESLKRGISELDV